MNKVILIGRLTRDPEVSYTGGEESKPVARYTLAVDRRFKQEGGQTADFIPCVAFNKQADFAERWLKKGTKIAAVGRIVTGSYMDRDGRKIYTTNVVVEESEFAESKSSTEQNSSRSDSDGFMSFSDGLEDELPF